MTQIKNQLNFQIDRHYATILLLEQWQFIQNEKTKVTLEMQADCNLVLYVCFFWESLDPS